MPAQPVRKPTCSGSFTQKWQNLFSFFLLIALSLLVYSDCFTHDFLSNWDDTLYVTDNRAIQNFSLNNIITVSTTNYDGNYAPLHLISYMLDHAIWGLEPIAFKTVNILLQGMCGVLLYRILITTGGVSATHALLASALFVIHPVQTESVAWISQRKTLLATLFLLLSYQYYSRFASTGSRKTYAISLMMFFASLLSKSAAVGLPLLLLGHDYIQGTRMRSSLLRALPFICIAAGISLLTFFSQSNPDVNGGIVSYHGGTFASNLRLAISLPASYLGIILWPVDLSPFYPEKIPALLSVRFVTGFLLASLFVTAIVILLKRKSVIALPLIVIAIGFLPVMQIIPILPSMNDRYCHIPMIGVAILLAVLLHACRTRANAPAIVSTCMVLIILSSLTWNQTKSWQDSITLWETALDKYPDDGKILSLLGDAWRAAGQNGLAIEYLERAIHTGNKCEALQKSAAIRMADHSFDIARLHLHRIVAECNTYRKLDSLLMLAESFHKQGNLPEAATAYENYVVEAPDSFTGHNALGNIYLQLGRHDESQKSLLKAVEISEESASKSSLFAISTLAEIRKKTGRTADFMVLNNVMNRLSH